MVVNMAEVMAAKTVNKTDTINNSVEKVSVEKNKNNNGDITSLVVVDINKPSFAPKNKDPVLSATLLTQEAAVNEFLAGENEKSEFEVDDTDLFLQQENEIQDAEIEFKSDHLVLGVNEMDKLDFMSTREMVEEVIESSKRQLKSACKISAVQYLAKCLKKRSIRCLNKMKIMEDVREGCDAQPSSPGHAELGTTNEDDKSNLHLQNGFEDESKNENSQEVSQNIQDSDQEEKDEKLNGPESNHDKNIQTKEEVYSNPSSPVENGLKRKQEIEETAAKRLRTEVHENFLTRDKILNEFLETIDYGNPEQVQHHTEQLIAEIRTLNELAKEKEMEWNNIIHLKKMKEELLLRLDRKKHVVNMSKHDFNDSDSIPVKNSNQSILKSNLNQKYRFQNSMLKPQKSLLLGSLQNNLDLNGGLDLRRQRPVLDVQSIIADYRQRHPEAVPRRGRRIRNSQHHNNGSSSILNFSSMALGSGSQMRHNLQDVGNELGLILSAAMEGQNRADGSRPSSAESNTNEATSFKDMLVQFAKLSQNERNELIQNAIKPPPPYPEVTVHPVVTNTTPTNSLLHGILTKSPTKGSKSSFSPTLARLLTAPERSANPHLTASTPTVINNLNHPSNMSISEILSSSKARNEITITPVAHQFDAQSVKGKAVSHEDEEAEDSADRLVIDESNEHSDARRATSDNNSDVGDEIPQCQGCSQRQAQFVCAGCGNQWYCSRDCQVAAWDEHSEVCSG